MIMGEIMKKVLYLFLLMGFIKNLSAMVTPIDFFDNHASYQKTLGAYGIEYVSQAAKEDEQFKKKLKNIVLAHKGNGNHEAQSSQLLAGRKLKSWDLHVVASETGVQGYFTSCFTRVNLFGCKWLPYQYRYDKIITPRYEKDSVIVPTNSS